MIFQQDLSILLSKILQVFHIL